MDSDYLAQCASDDENLNAMSLLSRLSPLAMSDYIHIYRLERRSEPCLMRIQAI